MNFSLVLRICLFYDGYNVTMLQMRRNYSNREMEMSRQVDKKNDFLQSKSVSFHVL